MSEIYVQESGHVVRRLVSDEAPLLHRWLNDVRVLAFYEGRDRPQSYLQIQRHYFERHDRVTRCVVERAGLPIGYAQFYPLDDGEQCLYGYAPDINVYGMDQFIGEPAVWNKGTGRLLVSALSQYLFSARGADCVVVDPEAWNRRAIRCYEHFGFRKVRYLPCNELHEGVKRSCWLMERRRR